MPFQQQLDEAMEVLQASATLVPAIDAITTLAADALLAGHTLYTAGNGGSAADALHLAEELIGRYRGNRRPLPAICLNADIGALTCIANDFGYDEVFARQLAALGRPGDVLVVFSTSGHSPNILNVLRTARSKGVISIALLGKDGGAACALADHALIVPSNNTARIQEVHTLILHAICEEVEQRLANAIDGVMA
ncbi:phosphoheptose isomerase [Chloroflexus islandicus]|uniref:Phosphoheptose isomerase n=1 Tax=Chloroflexus islandicus TaxID=1707952 RepID=A0A178LSH5_9CHLR|nr:SIS domain-containing protein [Chloroflexus islandicus]OAN36353.1 phosphoheptose isomerase [Chloroflexus islandicus]